MTKILDTVKNWLEKQNIEYSVQAETFIIDGDGPKPFKYVPNFIIHGKRFHGKTVIVEPITSFAPQGGLKRVQTFRHQFSSKYHIVIITKNRMLDKIPQNAYDQLIEFEKLDKSKIRFRKSRQ
ncbi:MAG: hypothetical protein J7K40_01655 [candidate division Zixibacteria bacterium]|nr:hypothetical protein [candidate division Zixibacteria bacterium]